MIRDTSAQDAVVQPTQSLQLKKYLPWVLGVGILLVLAVIVIKAWMGNAHAVSAARLSFGKAAVGTLVRDASVTGRVVAAVSPTVYASATGAVTLKVKAGDSIKKGQVLALIESLDVKEELKREQSSLDQLEAEVARGVILSKKQKLTALRDAEQAELDLVSAKRAVERIEPAYKEGVIAKVDYLKARDTLNSAEIRSKHASQTADLEGEDIAFGLKTRESQLQRQRIALSNAQRRVDELTLRAPVDGIVGTLSVSNGTVAVTNTALMTLVDLSQLEVEVEVPESYVGDLALGMRAEIELTGVKATGRLSAISPEVVKNQVLARLRFEGEPPLGLRQSQRASARLLIEEKPNVLLLPRGPFIESEGGRFVYVLDKGVATRREARLGASSISSVQVLSGVHAGETVVISGTDTFANAPSVAVHN